MMTLPPSVKIYVATEPVDARKGFDGLAALVQAEFGLEPLSGHVFGFINRRGHAVQLLFWDRSGFCIVEKRLEAGTFRKLCLPELGERRTPGDHEHEGTWDETLAEPFWRSGGRAARTARRPRSRPIGFPGSPRPAVSCSPVAPS